MNFINFKNLTNSISIGRILKPHGIQGEMFIEFFIDIFDNEELPFLIFELEGIMVPFEIVEFRSRSWQTATIRLEGINTEEEARQFTGLDIHVLKDVVRMEEKEEVPTEFFVGFQIFDADTKKSVGIISKVDSSTDNTLFIVDNEGDELLIPASEDYIININMDEKTIQMSLPSGLLDL